MHADNMASKKLLIFLIWIEGLGCHCQRLSAEVTPNLKHRSNIPKQTLEEILNSQIRKPPPSPVSGARGERVHIPKQSLSEILKLHNSPKTSTEDPIKMLSTILKRSQQYQESEILSILGLQKQSVASDRTAYTESDTTHKRSLTSKQDYNQIEHEYLAKIRASLHEQKDLKPTSKDLQQTHILAPQEDWMTQDQVTPKEYLNAAQNAPANSNRDKVFSILSSIAKSKALYELSKVPVNMTDNVEGEALLADPGMNNQILQTDEANIQPIEPSPFENPSVQNMPNLQRGELKELQNNFQFIPNLENEAIAQLLNLPQDSNSQIKVTLENLENIIKYSQHKDRNEVVGILGLASNPAPVQLPLMAFTEEDAFLGTPGGDAGFPDKNSNQRDLLEGFENQKDLLEQFVKNYESEQIQKPVKEKLINVHDQSRFLLNSVEDDQLHVQLLTQLPPEMLVRLEAEVPSLSSMISIAKGEQANLNQNIGFRQRLLNQPARFTH